MNLTLGVFDIFAYSVPGSLYLGLLLYIVDRTSWLKIDRLASVNTTLLIIGGILASYLLGQLTYMPRRFIEQYLPRWLRGVRSARHDFLDRVPAARRRPYVDADSAVLLAAIELKAPDSAVEISRLRASGIALRSAAFAFLLGAVAAGVELVRGGGGQGLAAFCLPLFGLGFAAGIRSGFVLAYWATLKTLEIAFWMPDIDNALGPPPPDGVPPP